MNTLEDAFINIGIGEFGNPQNKSEDLDLIPREILNFSK
jgi:hypothetical protein